MATATQKQVVVALTATRRPSLGFTTSLARTYVGQWTTSFLLKPWQSRPSMPKRRVAQCPLVMSCRVSTNPSPIIIIGPTGLATKLLPSFLPYFTDGFVGGRFAPEK